MKLLDRVKKSQNKKGFTLVELIVVLVILAILAAILVPALLGYIDKAKEKQYALEARSVYTASQAALSEAYASTADVAAFDAKTYLSGDAVLADVEKTADVTGLSYTSVTTSTTVATAHQKFTIDGMEISFTSSKGDDVTATLANGTWTITK